ncbi:MAG: hypothetical protein IKP54_07440 [Bacteroidales bacterium]|nr:hypothetical protein [Bacteroidales bacterium]
MDNILTKDVHCQKSLFSRKLPFEPHGYLMLYVESFANEEINLYFHKNMEKVCRILGESFTYLPAMLGKLSRIVEYNWPETNPAWMEKAKSEPSWIQSTYQEILSYRIDNKDETPELSSQITESPMLMRYEYTSDDGHIFTIFPLLYRNNTQFEQLLTAIAQVPRLDSNIFDSTLIEHPIRSSRLRENQHIDPRDNADQGRIDVLADEIRQRIKEMRLIGVSDFVIKKLITLPDPKLSTLRITKDYRIILPDYNDMEISLPTLSKVVYFFYLRHPKGLRFKELVDHREELLQIYSRISNRDDSAKMKQSIDDLVDSTHNSINEKCSRIRAAFVSQFSDDLAKNYYITGYSSQAKYIPLDRSLVMDEAGIITQVSQ